MNTPADDKIFCHACGAELQKSHRFCAHCGAAAEHKSEQPQFEKKGAWLLGTGVYLPKTSGPSSAQAKGKKFRRYGSFVIGIAGGLIVGVTLSSQGYFDSWRTSTRNSHNIAETNAFPVRENQPLSSASLEPPTVGPASGLYEMEQLEKLLVGKGRDYVIQFLGDPSSITTRAAMTAEEKGKTVQHWRYLMNDSNGHPIRQYLVSGGVVKLKCTLCDEMTLILKGASAPSVKVTSLIMINQKDMDRAKRETERPFVEDDFKRRVLSIRTSFGVPIFSKVELNGSDLHLWLSDASFAGPNMRNFAEIGTDYARLCDCQPVTYIGLDMTYLGGGQQILMQFKYDEQTKQSVLR